jgi:hypothetical protein
MSITIGFYHTVGFPFKGQAGAKDINVEKK